MIRYVWTMASTTLWPPKPTIPTVASQLLGCGPPRVVGVAMPWRYRLGSTSVSLRGGALCRTERVSPPGVYLLAQGGSLCVTCRARPDSEVSCPLLATGTVSSTWPGGWTMLVTTATPLRREVFEVLAEPTSVTDDAGRRSLPLPSPPNGATRHLCVVDRPGGTAGGVPVLDADRLPTARPATGRGRPRRPRGGNFRAWLSSSGWAGTATCSASSSATLRRPLISPRVLARAIDGGAQRTGIVMPDRLTAPGLQKEPESPSTSTLPRSAGCAADRLGHYDIVTAIGAPFEGRRVKKVPYTMQNARADTDNYYGTQERAG